MTQTNNYNDEEEDKRQADANSKNLMTTQPEDYNNF